MIADLRTIRATVDAVATAVERTAERYRNGMDNHGADLMFALASELRAISRGDAPILATDRHRA